MTGRYPRSPLRVEPTIGQRHTQAAISAFPWIFGVHISASPLGDANFVGLTQLNNSWWLTGDIGNDSSLNRQC